MDGNLKLPDFTSKDFGRRAVAELIVAVLALARKGATISRTRLVSL